MTALSIYAEHAPQALALGYSPIPIVGLEKRPATSGWQRHCDAFPTTDELSRYSAIKDAGLGIALGSRSGVYQIIAIDLDVEGDDLDKLSSALPASPMEKRGAKGLTRYYRADVSLGTKRYRTNYGRGLADLQAHGSQTVLPPSHHPLGIDYAWTAGPVAAYKLPVFDFSDRERFEDAVASLGWLDRETVPIVALEPAIADVESSDEDDICQRLNARALGNLDWVRLLDLTGYRPTSNGAEAVAHWRPSGNGNVMEIRKPNLKFHSTGIRDMGTGIGYSAIDVVMKAKSLSQDDAFGWLSDATGMMAETNDGVDWDQLFPTFLAKREALRLAELADAHQSLASITLAPTGLVWERHGEPSPFPEPFWFIKGFLPTEGNTFLAGMSTAGKTFVAISLAVALATGAPFMGMPIRQTTGSAFIVGEGRSTIRKRLAAAVIGVSQQGYDTSGKLPISFMEASLTVQARRATFDALKAEKERMKATLGVDMGVIFVDTLAVVSNSRMKTPPPRRPAL